MRKSIYRFSGLLLFWCNFSCQQNGNEIIIRGNIKNIPDGKVYLTEAHKWNIYIDSADCKKGEFTFKLNYDSTFIPFMASIYFSTTNPQAKVESILFFNEPLSKRVKKINYNNGFYLERGQTNLVGDMNDIKKVNVRAGLETELMYKLGDQSFGYLGNRDSVSRKKYISYCQNKIKEYPQSYYLLQNIVDNKEQYTAEEMKSILLLFNQNLQHSKFGIFINNYILWTSKEHFPYLNVRMKDDKNNLIYLIDTSYKLNMLIFWASWCGPCRIEIPQLRVIRNEFKPNNLRMVSISIDESQERWKEALKKENMLWEQVVVESNTEFEKIKAIFGFSSIPVVVFTDSKGKLIKKMLGYYPENEKLYREVILQNL